MVTMNQEIAKVIIQQLAIHTGRFKSMIGAYQFVAIENGVYFRFKARNKVSANLCQIKLNGKDLYDVKLKRIHGNTLTVKAEAKDLYNDQLTEWFEKTTGLYLSL